MVNNTQEDNDLESKIRWIFFVILSIGTSFLCYKNYGLIGLQSFLEVLIMLFIGTGICISLGLLFSRTKISIKNIFLPILAIILTGFQYWFDPTNFPLILSIAILFGAVIFLATAIGHFFGRK